MQFTFEQPPKTGDYFTLHIIEVVGTARTKWFIDGDFVTATVCDGPPYTDQLYISPRLDGKELHIIGTDDVDTAELRFRFVGTNDVIEVNPVEHKADMVTPEMFPKILDLLHRTGKISFKASDDARVTLRHTGTRLRPGPIKVEINGSWKGTIGAEGYFTALQDFLNEASSVADLLRDFNRDPRSVLRRSGRETGVCAVCGRLLTNPESVRLGIGPICDGRVSR